MTLISARKVSSLTLEADPVSGKDRRSHSRRPHPTKITGSKGFTVVEMLVVVAIITVGTAFTAMYAQSFYRHYKLSAFKAALPNAINFARARAIGAQKWTSLEFRMLHRRSEETTLESTDT